MGTGWSPSGMATASSEIGGTGHTRSQRTGRYERNGSLSSLLRGLGLMDGKYIPPQYLTAGVWQRMSYCKG